MFVSLTDLHALIVSMYTYIDLLYNDKTVKCLYTYTCNEIHVAINYLFIHLLLVLLK